MTETIAATVEPRANPYVGPRSLRFGEQLHGRRRELDELRDAVVADRVVLLYSPSGAGKSSLLEAGMRPELEAKGFFVAPTIRVNQDVPGNRYAVSAMLSLDEAQLADRRIGRQALSATTLAEYVSSADVAGVHAETEICLIFDQFEEVFTLDPVDVAVKAEFFAQLGQLLHDRGVWAVIAIREDYIAHLDTYLKEFPRRLATRLRLDFLDERSALAAVRNPAATMGVEFTDEAARQLVSDLRTIKVTRGGVPTREQGPHVEPVQLQVVCSQLWSRLPAGTSGVAMAEVVRYADTDNALAQFYADQVAAVAAATGESERTIRDWFEHRLVTPHGFRAQAFEFPGDHGLAVLKALEDAYLIRAESRRGVNWYELTHDRMIAPLVESNVEWREARLNPLQKRAAEWDDYQRPVGLLVGGDVLTDAETWISRSTDATEIERAFIADSRRHEDDAQAELQRHIDETKRAKRRSVIFAVLAIAAVGGLITAAIATLAARHATERARSSAQEAEARDLAARSTAADNPYDAVLLALEAEFWTESPLVQSRSAWRDAVGGMARQPALRSRGAIDTGTNPTSDVAWNPDGTVIAIGNTDGRVRLFDAATGDPIGDPINTGTDSTLAVEWNPDGTVIATVNFDGRVRLFDAATGDPVGDPIHPNAGSTLAVAWNAAGTGIATFNFDGRVRLFDAATGDPIGDPIDTGADETVVASWNPDGTIIATANLDGVVRLFDAATGDPIGDPIDPSAGYTFAMAWKPDGTVIATVNDDDGSVRLFDAATSDPIGDPIDTGTRSTAAVAWNPDGIIIATGNFDGTLRLFDAATGDPVGDPIDPSAGYTATVAWNPDGTVIATGNFDGTLRLFDAATRDPIGDPIDTGTDPTSAVEWNPDRTVIATGNFVGTMRLFDAATGDPIGDPIDTGTNPTAAVAWSPDGTIIATSNFDGTMRLFDAATGDPIGDPIHTRAHETAVVAWNPDGTIIATGNLDGTMRLFDAATGDPIGDAIDTGAQETVAVAWSPDGTIIATGNVDETMRLFDAATGDPIGDPIDTGAQETVAVAWSPDGTSIATGNRDGTMRLFDAATGDPIGDPIDIGGGPAWSPDGTIIATGNHDGTVRLFDVATGDPIGDPIDTGTGYTSAVAWNRAGTIIASVNADGTIHRFSPWSEAAACDYLRTVMTAQEMDSLVGIDGAQSKCAHQGVVDLTPIPILDHPLP